MAFWHRRKDRRVFIYIYRNGKQEQLKPRSDYKHLDTGPDHNVDAWIKQNLPDDRERTATAVPGKLARQMDDYLRYLTQRGKDPKTVADHRRMLNDFIIPYFVGDQCLPEPNDWPSVSAKLSGWMRNGGQSEHQVLRANSAIRGFWEYLCDEQQVLSGVQLRLRAPIRREEPTPLKRVVTPDEALAFVRRASQPSIKLMALLGYFFSLRPQETFALRKVDFLAGSKASVLEACRSMKAANLYDRLAVDVQRQRKADGKFGPPKAYSRGWVGCFNEQAARLLVEILLAVKDPEALLIDFLPDWNHELWGRHGIGADPAAEVPKRAELTLKDLRRSSIYWLGHYTDIGLEKLKSHARHRKADTTLLYLRRPGEKRPDELDVLDLDA
jgi:integrase